MGNRAILAGVLLLALAALLWATDRTVVVADGNLQLSADARQRGDMIVLSGNVDVPAGARIDGALLVLCCNVIMDGEVAGDLHLVSGNLSLGESAVVHGVVSSVSANADFHPSAVVAGRQRGPGLALTLARAFALVPAMALGGLAALAVGLLRRRAGRQAVAVAR